jgi:archaemetzincin
MKSSVRDMPDEVRIHPFGEIDRDLVKAVNRAVADRFGMIVAPGADLIVPARAYSATRRQYLSTAFLDELSSIEGNDEWIRLGITAVDLYVPELNFVFGEASSADHAAVFSVARLDPRRYGDAADERILLNRAVTEAIHELGHVFGLGHCRRSNCVMWFSNTLTETDRKGSRFCLTCAEQLEYRRRAKFAG